jgi:isopenicillin N synthase-like dioxygenase
MPKDLEMSQAAPTPPPLAAPALSRFGRPNEVPVIDFAPLAGHSQAAIDAVAREVDAACREIGFFTVINHPVPAAQIRAAFVQAARFFALPLEAKMAVYMGHSAYFRGYLPMDQRGDVKDPPGRIIPGFQALSVADRVRKPNLNEAFQIGLDLTANDPDVLAGKPLHGPNLWPADLPGFRDGVLAYFATMRSFAALLASVFARSLGLDQNYFAAFYKKPLIQLRLLHYLPQHRLAAYEGGDSRSHTDAGGFTMLQQDDVGGLEIKTKSGEWIVVPPVENSFVVNIGDSMMMWTNRRFVSTMHRVVNQYGRERFSIGVFANPDYDTVIVPLSTCVSEATPPQFEQMVAGEALLYLYSKIWPSTKG